MQVKLVRNEENKVIGWDLIRESDDDDNTLAHIRNMQFFGLDESRVRYDGYDQLDGTKHGALGSIERIKYRREDSVTKF